MSIATVTDSIVTSEDVKRQRAYREELEELLNREELMWAQKAFYMGIGIQDTSKLWLDKGGPRIESFKLRMNTGIILTFMRKLSRSLLTLSKEISVVIPF